MDTIDNYINEKNYIKQDVACSILGISKMTLYRIEKKGQIKGVKYGRNKYYKHEELYRYIDSILI